MQFSDRLRQRYTKVHRVAGRFYVAAAFIAAPLGFYIQFFQERLGTPRAFSVASASHATLWMASTAIAFAFILNGKVQQHRQWITRSVVVGPGVFLAVHAIIGITRLGETGRRCHRNRSLGSVSPLHSSWRISSCNGRNSGAPVPPRAR